MWRPSPCGGSPGRTVALLVLPAGATGAGLVAACLRTGVDDRAVRLRAGARARGGLEDHLLFPSALARSEEHTSELQSRPHLLCRLLLDKKNQRHPPRRV